MKINAQMKMHRTGGAHTINYDPRAAPSLPRPPAPLHGAVREQLELGGEEVRGKAGAEGRNFIVNSCLF